MTLFQMKSTYVLYHNVHDGRLNAFLDPLITTNTLCCRGDAPLSPLSVAVSLQPDDNLSPQQQQSPLIPLIPLCAYTHIAGAGPLPCPGLSALGLGCPCSFGLQEVGGSSQGAAQRVKRRTGLMGHPMNMRLQRLMHLYPSRRGDLRS